MLCLGRSVRFQALPSPLFPVTNQPVEPVAQPKKDVDWLPQSQAKGKFFIDAGM